MNAAFVGTLGAALGFLATPASAISYFAVYGAQAYQPASFETLAVDFDHPDAIGHMIYTTDRNGVVTPCTPGTPDCVTIDGSSGTRPDGDPSNFLSTTTSNSRATFDFAGVPLRGVSFYTGSLDNYNIVEFLDSGGNLKATWVGETDLDARFGGNTPAGTPFETRIYFNFAPGDAITAIRFFSPVPAFEIDNIAVSGVTFSDTGSCLHVGNPSCITPPPPMLVSPPAITAVPEPAVWTAMIVGFAAVGAASRRRRATFAA